MPETGKSPPNKHGVVALLENAAGRMLFIRRGLTLSRAPGVWCFVGGAVEDGESYSAAIEREVREEVGLTVRAGEKFHESISPNGEFLLHWIHVAWPNKAELVCPHPVEVAEVRWVSITEALALDPILPSLRAWLHARQPREL